jgi:hypothetical protein
MILVHRICKGCGRKFSFKVGKLKLQWPDFCPDCLAE